MLSSNKFVSVRHEIASDRSNTSGAVAALVRKKYHNNVSAKHIVELYKVHFKENPEWHHSGFYTKTTSFGDIYTMGRTWFISYEITDYILEHYEELEKEFDGYVKQQEKELQSEVMGFYYIWEEDLDHPIRKGKRNLPTGEYYKCKVLHSYKGLLRDAPKFFTPCKTEEEFKRIIASEGKKYLGYDEPRIVEFM